MSVLNDPKLESLLAALHARSDEQLAALRSLRRRAGQRDAARGHGRGGAAQGLPQRQAGGAGGSLRRSSATAFAAPIGARRIVELGTWFGVSTLYLAAAVRDNAALGGLLLVVGTEHEQAKARHAARANFAEAGLSRTSSTCAKATCARP